MASSSEAVEELKTRLQEGSTAIDDAMESLSETQDELRRLTDGQAALQKVVDDLTDSLAAIDKQIASMTPLLANALETHDDLVELLRTALPEARRTAVTAAVKAIDDEIAEFRAALQAAREALAGAQRDAELANQTCTERSDALKAAQAALKQLPASLQSLQANATKLAASAKAAADAGHPAAAFVLDDQLANTLTELGTLTQPSHRAELQEAVAAAWTEVASARSDANEKAAALAAAQAALGQADTDLAAKAGQRDAAVMAKLAEFEKQWAAAPDPSKELDRSKGPASSTPNRAPAVSYPQAQDNAAQ
jgi:chemotaxis protein MotB